MRQAAKNIHLVDKCLMVFMAVLLLQSAHSLFFPGDTDGEAGGIDVIVRTSSAAIFGYFLSANFNRRPDSAAEGQAVGGSGTVEPPAQGQEAPRARIGFQMQEEGGAPVRLPPSQLPSGDSGGEPCRLQVLTAWVIGLFCLFILLLLRSVGVPEDGSATATVAQFRDFVSGCVGFLIGCPTRGSSQSQP